MDLLTRSTHPPRPRVSALEPACYFITGTGRCGTMLLARLFDRATNGVCEHEAFFRHDSMVARHVRDDWSEFERDIDGPLARRLEGLRGQGTILGVSSGHCHFAIPRLSERLGEAARYILIIRKPEEFVRSALARGFFDPSHPNYCEQIVPNANEPIAARWQEATPIEKCLWYWSLVNGSVLRCFEAMPTDRWRVVRLEDFSPQILCDLAAFVGLRGISLELAGAALATGVNVTPGARGGEVNPYSLPASLGAIETWTDQQLMLLERYCGDLRAAWYGSSAAPLTRPVTQRGVRTP